MKGISSIFRSKDTLESAKKEGAVVVADSPEARGKHFQGALMQ
jgi:hypothetical protein